MVAWHGSPHDHNKFDLSKIGTGEGVQAYGYGLYFAENKEVGEHYRDQLSNQKSSDKSFMLNGKESSTQVIEDEVVRAEVDRVIEFAGDSSDVKDDLDTFMMNVIAEAKSDLEYEDDGTDEFIKLNNRIKEAKNIIYSGPQ